MATATDVALDHYTDRQSLVDATGEVAGQMWSQVNPNHIADSWAEQLPELTSIVSGAQLGAARQADRYTTDALEAEGLDAEAVAAVDPTAFSGSASDGRGLMALLTNPVVVTLLSIQDGMDVARALFAGRSNLDMMVRTQVADAGRAADQVSLTTRPKASGYVRIAVGNSCARCLILSGRFYQFNTGFLRHPRCDCIHVPAHSARSRFASDPRQVYDRMTTVERTRAGFTKADQWALDHGSDLSQIVNAKRGMYTAGGHRFTTEGTTRRGLARSRLGKGTPRITPDEIFQAAGDNRAEALRLLHRNGYLIEDPARLAADIRFTEAAPGAGAASGVRLPALAVRPALSSATSVRQVERAFEAEARRITGRRIRVDFGRADLDNAREFAEGGLRVLEEFPDVELRLQVGRLRSKAIAETDTRSGQVTFAEQYANDRALYSRAVSRSNASGFHRRAMATPAGTAVHESIHAVHFQYNPLAVRRKVSRLMEDLAGKAGLDVPTYVQRELGDYALEHMDEAIAQAVSDAMVSGAPSELSRGVLQVMRDQYRLGRMHVPASQLQQAVDHAGLTVKQLQDIARVRGVAFTSRARKPELVRLLDEAQAPPVAALARPHTPAEFDSLIEAAATDRAALAETRVRYTGSDFEDRVTGLPRSVAPETQREIREAFGAYQSADDRAINEFLRGADLGDLRTRYGRSAAEAVEPSIRALDVAFEHSGLKSDVVLWRGLASGRGVLGDVRSWGDDLAGRTWIEAAYSSTSSSQKIAERFTANNGVRMRILAPKGQQAIRLRAGDVDEFEVMLGRGAQYRVVRDRGWTEIVNPKTGKTVKVRDLDVEIVPAVPRPLAGVERQAVDRKALRDAARERNRVIESGQGTARLLAEVDELLAKKADLSVIRERLDPALIQPEQVFAGADRATLDALRKAVDTGDVVKVRSAITRASTKAKLKPISRAGTKVKFDPELMESVAGVEIRPGARVVIVRRGTTLTLPDGTVIQLEKARVVSVTKPTMVEVPATQQQVAAELARAELTSAGSQGDVIRDLYGGQVGEVRLVRTPSGTEVVTKRLGTRYRMTRAEIKREVDAEVLGPQLIDAVGGRAAAVVPDGSNSVIAQFIDGKNGQDFAYGSGDARARVAAMRESDQGRLLGIADYLGINADRHEGNFIVDEIERIWGIDHGAMFSSEFGRLSVPNGFFSHFLAEQGNAAYGLAAKIDVAPADLAIIRTRLQALAPAFAARGRAAWLTKALSRLEELEKRADPAARRLLSLSA